MRKIEKAPFSICSILTLPKHCFEFVAEGAIGMEAPARFVVSAAAALAIDANGRVENSIAFADSSSLRAEPH